MRNYPRNSPQAAARIVALMLIADGHISVSEENAVDDAEIAYELGLEPEEFRGIVQTLCEDYVLDSVQTGQAWMPVPESVYAALMAEIDDVRLQRTLLRVCREVAKADDHWADGERAVLDAAQTHWAQAARDRIDNVAPAVWLNPALPTGLAEPVDDAGPAGTGSRRFLP